MDCGTRRTVPFVGISHPAHRLSDGIFGANNKKGWLRAVSLNVPIRGIASVFELACGGVLSDRSVSSLSLCSQCPYSRNRFATQRPR